MFWWTNSWKLLQLDERHKFTDSKSSVNSKQVKIKENYAKKYYNQCLKTKIKGGGLIDILSVGEEKFQLLWISYQITWKLEDSETTFL